MSALLTQNPQMFVKCIEGKVHHTVSHRTELLLSPLAAAFKSIKMEAYTAKHPEAYAAMEDQIETLGYDDAVNTFQYCVENMYPSGTDKKEDFNEVCDTCDYTATRACSLAGMWAKAPLERRSADRAITTRCTQAMKTLMKKTKDYRKKRSLSLWAYKGVVYSTRVNKCLPPSSLL